MRHRLAVTLGIVVAVGLTVALAAQTDVTGKWNVTIDTPQGTSTATLTFQQEGEKLTGELVSVDDAARLGLGTQGTLEFEGTIIGDKIEWLVEVDAGGAFIEIKWDGTVDGDEMMGTFGSGGYSADWTATRAQ